MNMHSFLMCLYEMIAHIFTPIHLCLNEVNYEHVWPKGVYVKGLLEYTYTLTHENMSIMHV